jgi:hypothetical protein
VSRGTHDDQLSSPVVHPRHPLGVLLGLILPGLCRIRQRLTPLAATGLVIIMIGAPW